jgi:hypothetical protein
MTSFNNEAIETEGYLPGLVAVRSNQITTGMFEELIKEFEHCWFDGIINRLVIG